MSEQVTGNLILSLFRVLDLTDWEGWLCGRIFADLGADVIKVEPPGGDPGRRLGPFFKDQTHNEKSLFWFAYNLNKRSITLNLETFDGQQIFKKLISKADFVIESFSPGYLNNLGLDFNILSQLNPKIILVSITAFGQTGPYHDLKASDLVITAMGGMLFQMGDPDRAPLSVSFPQAYLNASLEGAVGALVAHYHRQTTGEGQHIDVSAQASLLGLEVTTLPYWQMGEKVINRSGGRSRWRTADGIGPQVIYRCKDGFVAFGIFSGALGAKSMRGIVKWMDEEGLAPDFLKGRDWEAFALETSELKEVDRFSEAFSRFFENHTKSELYEGLLKRGIMGYPVSSIDDIYNDPQLTARNYWINMDHEEIGATIHYPGAFAKFTETPIMFRHRPPLIGEHNGEIFGEMGISTEKLNILKEAGVI